MQIELRRGEGHEFATLLEIDDDATNLYPTAGIVLADLATTAFAAAEQARWRRSLLLQQVWVATAPAESGRVLGFAVLDILDGAPYLDQLAVRCEVMGRGIGRMLLRRAIAWAATQATGSLWLTTYGHLAWNRPFYEREGFVVMPEAAWGPGVAHHIAEQRKFLPDPEHRVAMCRPAIDGASVGAV